MAVEPQRGLQNRRNLAVVLGLVLALGGAGGVYLLTRAAANGGSTAPLVSVVVSTKQIDRSSKFSQDNVTVEKRPSDQLPPDAVTDPNTVYGQFAAIAIGAHAVVLTEMVVANTPPSGQAVIVPLDVQTGDVAMAIPVDDQKGVGGFIQQDDRIDIIADVSGGGDVRYAFQDVRVLRIGQAAQQAQGGTASLLVVELPRAQAEELAFLINGRGTLASVIRYVLRARDQYGKGYVDSGPLTPTASNYSDHAINPTIWNGLFPH